MRARRAIGFVVVVAITASTMLAGAQTRKPAPAAPAAAPAKKPAGGKKPLTPDDADGGPSESAPRERANKDGGGLVTESKTLDGGARVFRFGEVEVEGRLKSPQIVYFLRRVRAEFAAGDLGHRSFMRELGDTRNEPGF